MKCVVHLLFLTLLFSSVVANDLPYERFVSIGCCCVSRTQVNAHLEKRFGIDSSQFGGGQLFDWLIIRDYNKFSKALEKNLNDLFNRSDLLLEDKQAYPWVINTKYQMVWNHLFTRGPGQSIAPNILDLEYDIKKQKIDYLSEKFRNLKDYRTLYILAYPFDGNGSLQTKEPDKKVVTRVRDALLKLRGNNNFTLLYCPLVPKFNSFDNVKVIRINNGDEQPCTGNFQLWHLILSKFPFTLDKAGFDLNPLEQSKFND